MATKRTWPRRLAIGAAVTAALLGGAVWLLGRESTLQALVQKVANASGGNVAVTGVSGSLYGSMHVAHIVYRTPERIIRADQVDIDWSPLQFFSDGIAISKLYAEGVAVETLAESPPAAMPESMAPPFALGIGDARVASLVLQKQGSSTALTHLHLTLHGDARAWTLGEASVDTPWGKVAAHLQLMAQKPFALSGSASIVRPEAHAEATLGGDLGQTSVKLSGAAGSATGSAQLALAPFAAVPLRALSIKAQHIDPGLFKPALPRADMQAAMALTLAENGKVQGTLGLDNSGPAGTLDQQRLPLRSLHGTLAGSLSLLRLDGIEVDLDSGGSFKGQGSIDDKGVAALALHTERLDLKGLHARLHPTAVSGDIAMKGDDFDVHLRAAGLRLDAQARREHAVITLQQARLAAGSGTLHATGSLELEGKRAFKVKGDAEHFNPAALGSYPVADINAAINAGGTLADAWSVNADFTLRPSTLFQQALGGSGKLHADAKHVSNVDATLTLGPNNAHMHGSFGAPGEKLAWQVDARQLGVLHIGVTGSARANGVVSGTMAAPRTTLEADVNGLHASGEAWRAGDAFEGKLAGTATRFDPATLGAPLAGSINASFTAEGRSNAQWRASATLLPSTLAHAPLSGHASIAASGKKIGAIDLDLRAGANSVSANGSGEQLAWKVDAPDLSALGPDFAGTLKGSGTWATQVLGGTLDGNDLRLFGGHRLKSLHASASIGMSGQALVTDIMIANYANAGMTLRAAHLQTGGDRAAHGIKLSARNEDFDAALEARGSWTDAGWSGTIATLQNHGRYGFSLQAPATLRLGVAPGAGVAGLLHPERIGVAAANFKLPDGSVSIASLEKNGAHWRSKGAAAGVPLTYIGQFSPAVRENLNGDLALGATWDIERTPALAGSVHLFREKGDAIVGAEVPVVLGLRQFDARADVSAGALRVVADLDGSRAGRAHVDATMRLLDGRIENASALAMNASADVASVAFLAPLFGQPGLELDGTLKLALAGSGTFGTPSLNGSMSGERLLVRWAEQGIKLGNGQLRARLAGDELQLQQLSFDGPEGHAQASGALRFAGGEASMQLKLVADKLEILARPDRTVVVSGQSTLVRDQKRFALDGKFRAERAVIELAPIERPTMSDDVVILGKTASSTSVKAPASLPLAVDIEADLGENFYLKGMGLDAQLAGTVHIRAADRRPPRANGTIRVVEGTYAAYGQKLAIERGQLTFSGPYDNPALSILAVRKRPDGEQLSDTNVEAGVEVRGTALAPVARLVSTPNVSDSDKLAWLVLGHGMEVTAGQEFGVLSAAAGALLGGSGGGLQQKLASTIGIDELGLSQAKGLETTVVTVGKRLSKRAYLSFEQGTSTATSLVKLRYKVNPRITLQLQTGANTALDVLYSWAFD